MKNLHHLFIAFILVASILAFSGCSTSEGDSTGHEYMPDMGHSVAYEANVINEYFAHTWDDNPNGQTRRELSMPRKPVSGTVPRGYASVALANSPQARQAAMARLMNERIPIPMNGSAPYYYGDTDDERLRATAEITQNPFSATDARLKSGKELYVIYCGICHGDGGGGDGYLVRDDGKYPAQPANLLEDKFVNTTDGQYYHAIMYGKNVMGGYSDKLSYEERWNVIHYIRSMQAKAGGGSYGLVDEDATVSVSNVPSFVEAVPTATTAVTETTTEPVIEKLAAKGGDFLAAAQAGKAVTLENVTFALGKARLTSASKAELNKIVDFLKANPSTKAELSGHTDDAGIKAANQKLSQRRADAVKEYLVSKGATAANLTAVGYGSERPRDTGNTKEAKKRNRRTEFKIIK